MLAIRGETIPVSHERLNYTLRQPWGVVGRIVPFNHPMMFATVKIAAPLIAGNTVLVKPSEHTSLSILALIDDLAEIFPPGVVNVVTGYGAEAGDAIVAHPEWQGQSCGSTSRLIVHESIHDDFVEALAARIDGLRSGMPANEDTDTGAIVNQGQYDKVNSYIQLGKDEGARLVIGGHAPEDQALANGLFLRPALFDNVKPDSRLAQEEIFGPVLAAMPFTDYDDAIRIANSVQYGLTASVFTTDLVKAHRYARDVEAGYVWVNDTSRHFTGTPFGGFKNSGIGREEDLEEVLSYTQIKNVNVNLG